jgi:multicomponent Na+:H+ antiporter subunit E
MRLMSDALNDEPVKAEPVKGRELGWRIWQQLPLLVALVLLWMLLWGQISWLSLVSGVLVSVGVTRMFYLPPVELSGRFNPFWFVVFLARFLGDLVVASFQVAFQAIRPRGVTSNAVIAVDLVTRSDFVMTLTSIVISLIPGSIVLEVDRADSILYLHALNVRDTVGVERLRAKVLSVERSLVRALGSKQDLERTAR